MELRPRGRMELPRAPAAFLWGCISAFLLAGHREQDFFSGPYCLGASMLSVITFTSHPSLNGCVDSRCHQRLRDIPRQPTCLKTGIFHLFEKKPFWWYFTVSPEHLERMVRCGRTPRPYAGRPHTPPLMRGGRTPRPLTHSDSLPLLWLPVYPPPSHPTGRPTAYASKSQPRASMHFILDAFAHA